MSCCVNPTYQLALRNFVKNIKNQVFKVKIFHFYEKKILYIVSFGDIHRRNGNWEGVGVKNWSKLPTDSTKKLPTRKSVKITDVVYGMVPLQNISLILYQQTYNSIIVIARLFRLVSL